MFYYTACYLPGLPLAVIHILKDSQVLCKSGKNHLSRNSRCLVFKVSKPLCCMHSIECLYVLYGVRSAIDQGVNLRGDIFLRRFLGTTQVSHLSATHLIVRLCYIPNLAIWVDPCCKWLPNSIGYWEHLYMVFLLLLLSKGGLQQWDKQSLAAAPQRGACKWAQSFYCYRSMMIIIKNL